MLTKITRCDDVESLPLSSDPGLLAAQKRAAATLPDDDPRVEAARMQLARDGDEPTRGEVRDLVAVAVINNYAASSDELVLLDVPDTVARAHIRAVTSDELRRAELAAGPPPRRGQRVYARAMTLATEVTVAAEMEYQAARLRHEHESSRLDKLAAMEPPLALHEAHDDIVDAMSERDRKALHDFQLWGVGRDHSLASAALMRITIGPTAGLHDFDDGLVRGEGGFPIERLCSTLAEGHSVALEVAQHVRNLTRLGKQARRSSPSSGGKDASRNTPQGHGPADNAEATQG